MPFLTVAGFKTYYAYHDTVPPEKPPVVLIHGAGGTHQHWLYQVRDISCSVSYALDLPGHGRSDGPARDTIAGYGDWLVAFLDAMNLKQAVLVGHSMGGAIAMDVALRYPDRPVGLGLVATGARLRVSPSLLEGIRQNKEEAVGLMAGCMYGPEVPAELVRLGRRQLGETPADVLYQDFAACDAFDVMGQLGQLTLPALVVCGTKDRMSPFKYSVYLRDQISGAVLHPVEGAGHMVMVERPSAVVQALDAFLQRL